MTESPLQRCGVHGARIRCPATRFSFFQLITFTHFITRLTTTVSSSIDSSAQKKETRYKTLPPSTRMAEQHSKACCTIPPVVAKDYTPKGEYITIEGLKACKTPPALYPLSNNKEEASTLNKAILKYKKIHQTLPGPAPPKKLFSGSTISSPSAPKPSKAPISSARLT